MTASSLATAPAPTAAPAAKPNRRAENKARTRQKVLDSAKRLFMAHGYEGATMRDIAADAGLSTGAVFANFADKADLFNEVILSDFELQNAQMTEAVAGARSLQDKLLALLGSGYDFHVSQMPLLQAGISVSWSHGLNGELGERPAWKTVTTYVVEILDAGVAAKELKDGFDRQLLAEMMWDCYLANYRRAMFGQSDAKALKSRLNKQIELLLSAVRS
jgi:AcrR family transcriptional regulator